MKDELSAIRAIAVDRSKADKLRAERAITLASLAELGTVIKARGWFEGSEEADFARGVAAVDALDKRIEETGQ